MNPDRDSMASCHNGRHSYSKNRTGSFSSCNRNLDWCSKTSVGQAPNEPWFRNVILGSSPQYFAYSLLRGRVLNQSHPLYIQLSIPIFRNHWGAIDVLLAGN